MASALPKQGSGSEGGGCRSRAPGGRQGVKPLKLEAFYPFSYKKWPKVKDLNKGRSQKFVLGV